MAPRLKNGPITNRHLATSSNITSGNTQLDVRSLDPPTAQQPVPGPPLTFTQGPVAVDAGRLQLPLSAGVLGGGHHLHGLGDLLDVLDGLQPDGDWNERPKTNGSFTEDTNAEYRASYCSGLQVMRSDYYYHLYIVLYDRTKATVSCTYCPSRWPCS